MILATFGYFLVTFGYFFFGRVWRLLALSDKFGHELFLAIFGHFFLATLGNICWLQAPPPPNKILRRGALGDQTILPEGILFRGFPNGG